MPQVNLKPGHLMNNIYCPFMLIFDYHMTNVLITVISDRHITPRSPYCIGPRLYTRCVTHSLTAA